MSEVSILAIDLAKGSFQVCGVKADGAVMFNRSVTRPRLYQLLAEQGHCFVATAACTTSHHWGRVARSCGHEVRLTPAAYVKPFVTCQENDRTGAEARRLCRVRR